MRHLIKIVLGSALVLAMAACIENDNQIDKDRGDDMPPPGGGGGDPAPFEASFGDGFATAFQAEANTEPVDPMDGDIVDIDPTADPLEPPF